MEAARTPGQPDATIQYSAVRSGARQFGDYSVVDRTILSDSAAETAESDDVEQGPKVTEPPAW